MIKDISELTKQNIHGVFYDDTIGKITKLLSGSCLADLWDGGYVGAVAFKDTNNFAFLLNRYYCSTIETWICYGDCSTLLDNKKIVQTIPGRNDLTMLRRKIDH